ncbi:FadR/GntR family transcriptional regulator [Brachybacterium sp. AOP43-C2-M15]|uniref:FadR/GntR family transcriptional regulator n=1 Tax=Brachybacterium sp. AOP43-C2-M15 TaxID=3457661 RepID=UPI0040349F6D
MTAARTAFERALDQLGREIVTGALPPDHADTVEGFGQRSGASRSVVREVTRVLGAMGMLSAGRRVGLRVLPPESWDTLDPRVIRWRLDGPGSAEQVQELRSLRHAIEPAAAAAAAESVRRGTATTQHLSRAVRALEHAGSGSDAVEFLVTDQAFHTAVLDLSGNTMMIRLRRVIEEGLRHRALTERGARRPEPHDLGLHVAVAAAIDAGDAARAAEAMREIIERTSPSGR